MQRQIIIKLPAWAERMLEQWDAPIDSLEQAMELAVELASENVAQGNGGPFGAVVVDLAAGEVLGLGVNMVTSLGMSAAHAEIVALSLAQQAKGDWDLAQGRPLTLVTSCEPCAMCFGAIPWSGVRALVCGARKEDVEAAGFDEGDKPQDWAESLESRGIQVTMDVLRNRAAEVFDEYKQSGGVIYNPNGGGQ